MLCCCSGSSVAEDLQLIVYGDVQPSEHPFLSPNLGGPSLVSNLFSLCFRFKHFDPMEEEILPNKCWQLCYWQNVCFSVDLTH